jgi:hypothetical protein
MRMIRRENLAKKTRFLGIALQGKTPVFPAPSAFI